MNTKLNLIGNKECSDPSIREAIQDLKKEQAEVKLALEKNTELTQSIKDIIESVKGFFNFCAKAGRVGAKIAKFGTIFAVAITAFYHAVDALASHDILSIFKQGTKK